MAKVITKFRRESDYWDGNRSKKIIKSNRGGSEKSYEKKLKLRHYEEEESYIGDEDYSKYSNIRFK